MGAQTVEASGEGSARPEDRRRYPRAEAAWEITLGADSGRRWRTQTIDLNQFGIKVRARTEDPGPAVGSIVRVQLAPPDGKPPLSITGIVWRTDAEGAVIVFSNLATNEFHRLKDLTDGLLEKSA